MAGTRSLPSPSVLRRAHNIYIDDLWKSDGWGCTQWRGYSAQMLFWYGVAGAPYAGGSDLADRYLASIVGKRKISGVPLAKLKLWKSANRLVNDIRRETGMELVPWLAQTRIDSAWERLQQVYLIGPKIASWFLRDISFLMDYRIDGGPSRFSYGQQRSSEWFASLSLDVMKYFVPIDRWVFIGAKKIGALRPRSIRLTVQGIQANRRNHLQAASEIVEFAQQRNLDPRDLNAYWFVVGSKWIDGNGKPPP